MNNLEDFGLNCDVTEYDIVKYRFELVKHLTQMEIYKEYSASGVISEAEIYMKFICPEPRKTYYVDVGDMSKDVAEKIIREKMDDIAVNQGMNYNKNGDM